MYYISRSICISLCMRIYIYIYICIAHNLSLHAGICAVCAFASAVHLPQASAVAPVQKVLTMMSEMKTKGQNSMQDGRQYGPIQANRGQ